MARFKTILTDAGAILLTQALAKSETVTIDSVVMGEGVSEAEDKNKITALVSPVEVNTKLGDRAFIEGNPSLLKVSIQTLNNGLIEPVPIREIGLYADQTFFAYAWIEGEDTDNILPPPLNLEVADTIHLHELALFVTNQEQASIDVNFAFDGFVSHQSFNERFEQLKIGEHQIEAEAITTEKLAKGSVTTRKLANQSISTSKIKNGAITINKLAEDVADRMVGVGTRAQLFTQAGSFIVPEGITNVFVSACARGGNGGSGVGGSGGTGGGGGAGEACLRVPVTVTPNSTLVIPNMSGNVNLIWANLTLAAGGNGGNGNGSRCGAGGNSGGITGGVVAPSNSQDRRYTGGFMQATLGATDNRSGGNGMGTILSSGGMGSGAPDISAGRGGRTIFHNYGRGGNGSSTSTINNGTNGMVLIEW